MSGLAEGQPHALRSIADPMYLSTGDPGYKGGGTYSGVGDTERLQSMYENVFGPAGRDIKLDAQRAKRHQRWHPSDIRLPASLRGRNDFLTERVDGLITDATNSPFTKSILPYVYLDYPDHKIKWNVYSFDEGIASRVPYESAARVLPQTKRSFAGYTVRQGLAIAMEHNFMVSEKGRENFQNQLTQLVGSIQMTNDLDVHIALLQAPSYQKHMNEKYHDITKTTSQVCRQYVDLFGILQKIPNALDILIEDAKNHLKTWGSKPPTFLLCNGNLTTQLTMLPEKTNYLTNGPDGIARLKQGPDLPSYRGLSIINSRKFSMDAGTAPRDLLRRRVRVAEYYRIPGNKPGVKDMEFEFYDQSRDSMFRLSYDELLKMAKLPTDAAVADDDDGMHIDGVWIQDTGNTKTSTLDPGHSPDVGSSTTVVKFQNLDGSMTLKPSMSRQGRRHVQPASHLSTASLDSVGGSNDTNFQAGISASTLVTVDPTHTQAEQSAMSGGFGGMIWNEPVKSDAMVTGPVITPVPVLQSSLFAARPSQQSINDQYNAIYGLLDGVHKGMNSPLSFFVGGTAAGKSFNTLLCDIKEGRAHEFMTEVFNNFTIIAFVKMMLPFLMPRLLKLCYCLNGTSGFDVNILEFADVQTLDFDKMDSTYAYVHTVLEGVGIKGTNESDFRTWWTKTYKLFTELQADGSLKNSTGEYTFTPNGAGSPTTKTFLMSDAKYEDPGDFLEEFYTLVAAYKSEAPTTDHKISSDPAMVAMLGVILYAKFQLTDSKRRSTFFAGNVCDMLCEKDGDDCLIISSTNVSNLSHSTSTFVSPFLLGGDFKTSSALAESILQHTMTQIANILLTIAMDQMEQQAFARAVDKKEHVDPVPFFGEHHDLEHFQRAIVVDSLRHVLCTPLQVQDKSTGKVVSEQRVSILCHVLNHAKGSTNLTDMKTFANKYENIVLGELSAKASLSDGQISRHHDTCNIMLSEFDNSTGSQMSLCAPNLHLSTCQPLDSAIEESMAISVKPDLCVLQHALSVMHLPDDVSVELLHKDTSAKVSLVSYAPAGVAINLLQGFVSDKAQADKMFETKLGMTFVHLFHPAEAARERAKGAAITPSRAQKQAFCSALADALKANDRFDSALERAMHDLVMHEGSGPANVAMPYHSSCAATEQIAVPAYMTEEQGRTAFGSKVPVTQLPLRQFSNVSRLAVLPTGKDAAHVRQYVQQGGMHVNGMRGRMAFPVSKDMYTTVDESAILVHDVYGNRELSWSELRDNQLYHATVLHPWLRALPADTRLGTNKYLVPFRVRDALAVRDAPRQIYTETDPSTQAHVSRTINMLRQAGHEDEIWRTVVMMLVQRYFRDTRRFCYNGEGLDACIAPVAPLSIMRVNAGAGPQYADRTAMVGIPSINKIKKGPGGDHSEPTWNTLHSTSKPEMRQLPIIRHGLHPGGFVPSVDDSKGASGGASGTGLADHDIIILRPNIEHEMLGIIMGRGGTQELGCTFWGQTELSCYDDAQHGVWGMSYKYHERAIVTNERNLIRTFDVAFDGYNGGMDDSFVDWSDPESLRRFTQATYARDKPYNGPSMLVMALPRLDTQRSFPNPIVFHTDTAGNLSPDPQKDEVLPDIAEFMVFNPTVCPSFCGHEQANKYKAYMDRLGMFQWASVDQSSRPAGEACIANESASNMLAFQGTMHMYDKSSGAQKGTVMGSGHLGPSYVGVASVREGRGILNTHMQPQMIRQI